MVNFKSTFMNTKEYSDIRKKCVVNGERKLPLKDVARMLGYFKICDTPQRSQVYSCVRFEEKREYETLLF